MKVNFQRLILAAILCLISLGNASYAAVFNIVPKAGTTLPTTVATGQKVTADYTITNTTGSFHSGNYVKYLPPNVTQITTDATTPNLCGATFPLAANASCTLELSVAGAVNGNDPNPQNHLFACLGGCATCCAGTNFPLNVTVTSSQTASLPYIYISGTSTDLIQCPLSANGGSGGACTSLTNSTPPNFSSVYSSAFLTVAGTSYAYVSDIGNAVLWQCPLTANGTFSSCTEQGGTTTFYVPLSTTFATFSGTTYAYVSDDNADLYKCPLNPSTGGFSGSSCVALTNSSTAFDNTRSSSFATFGGTTYGYVSDGSNYLYQCAMSTTGSFQTGSCTQLSNPGSFFTSTFSSTFATFSGVTYAYIADHSNKLWQCPMNGTGGFSGNCTALTGSPTAFSFTENVSFNKTASGSTYAYVSDTSSSIYECLMNATGGFAGTCTALSTPPGESYSSATLFAVP